jgi:hypothetical protein
VSGYDQYARMAEGHNIALVPSLPDQESDAETGPLPGTPDVWQQAGPADTPKPDPVAVKGGASSQVGTGPDIEKDGGDAKHEHYWIHSVQETIERGYADFEAYSLQCAEGAPQQIFGLDDLRNRATIALISTSSGAVTVYFGKRDRIKGADPTTALPITGVLDYRARAEAYIVAIGGSAVIGVIEYHGEPTSDTLGALGTSDDS